MAHYKAMFQGKTEEFTIRNAVGEDAPAILDYMTRVDRETTFLAREPGEFEKNYSLETETALLDKQAESGASLYLIAVSKNGTIAASCICSFQTGRARTRHRADLAISVRQDYQRQGLARQLMEVQETWCRSQGIEKLCLEVDTKNLPAIRLYLSQGFVVEGTIHRETKMADGTYRDLYMMAKFL